MKERPWIWLIAANFLFISGIITLAVIAVKNRPQEVPITQEARVEHGR
jgi:hypothetical protein